MIAAAPEQIEAPTIPALPPLVESDDLAQPAAPEQIEQTGIDVSELEYLLLKLAHTVPSFSTESASISTCLPMNVVEEICWQLKQDHLLEVLGQQGPFNYTYSATHRGREQAQRLMDICGYLGPAPVSLQSYAAMLKWQRNRREEIQFQDVQDAVAELVLPETSLEVASLAVASGRSLFLFGPAGNGKTSLGRLLHNVSSGEVCIPYCISAGSSIIRIFDPQIHQRVVCDEPTEKVDRRWVRVKRPFVIAGGEMTMEELDLMYSPSLRFYEAPPHVKANGGTFLIDDFGRQRIEPHELLNRWIVPLESQTDHLTLHTGQKLEIPFELMLIVATNLQVSDVADPAFLRRMGYRLHIDHPTVEDYERIFAEYAKRNDVIAPRELIQEVVQRYKAENRKLRASEPRDLIERCRDVCRLHHKPFQLNSEVLNVAWRGYFGNAPK